MEIKYQKHNISSYKWKPSETKCLTININVHIYI